VTRFAAPSLTYEVFGASDVQIHSLAQRPELAYRAWTVVSDVSRDIDAPLADGPFSLAVMAPPAAEALLPADIERYGEAARIAELARRGAGAAATLQAYRADWAVFVRWCATRGKTSLPGG